MHLASNWVGVSRGLIVHQSGGGASGRRRDVGGGDDGSDGGVRQTDGGRRDAGAMLQGAAVLANGVEDDVAVAVAILVEVEGSATSAKEVIAKEKQGFADNHGKRVTTALTV
jgi:hypothetical protein